MPPLLLNLIYLLAAIAYLPVLAYQRVVLGKNRGGWLERFGFIPHRAGERPCVWIHAVSLGEVNATKSLVDQFGRRQPDYEVVISTTTDTGYAAARRLYPERLVFRYPLDFSFSVKRALRRIRPRAVVLMELEVWPNFVAFASGRGIAIGIANGRVTEERSMRRFRNPLIRPLVRRMFDRIDWAAVQTDTHARRFEELGVRQENIHVTGNLKYDTATIADSVPGQEELATAMRIERGQPLFVAGSTGPGEEEWVIHAFAELRRERPGLQLAIIPRKPERFDEVARLIESHGFSCRRRSLHPDCPKPHPDRSATCPGAEPSRRCSEPALENRPPVLLGDTMGELRKFYALADVVFVGRSLVPLGGSDMMEVAALGRPMCFGPHVENFADVADQLCAADAAVRLKSATDLAPALRRILHEADRSAAMGAGAQAVVRRNTGATEKTLDLLGDSLQDAPDEACVLT